MDLGEFSNFGYPIHNLGFIVYARLFSTLNRRKPAYEPL